MLKHRRVLTMRSVAPLAFVLATVLLFAVAGRFPFARRLLLLQWSLYGAAGVAFAARSVSEHGESWGLMPRVLAAFPAFHLATARARRWAGCARSGACAGEAPPSCTTTWTRATRTSTTSSPRRFGEHLDAIERAVGRPPAAVDALSDGDWMITFDDGGASALHAGEELARRSWRGHFFIATDLVGSSATSTGTACAPWPGWDT